MSKYIIRYEIETNYDKDELRKIIESLFEIPSLQYEDCDWFNFEYINISWEG